MSRGDAAPRPGWPALSLRSRLTALSTAAVAGALVLGALTLSGVLQAARVGALDAVVQERSAALAALVADDRVPATLPVAEPGEVAQVLDAAGGVLATSTTASRTLPVASPDVLAGWRERAAAEPDDVLVLTTPDSAYDTSARAAVRAATLAGEPVTVVTTVPLTEVEGLVHALRLALLLVVPVLTAGVGLVIWFVIGRALRPVEALRRGADAVARTGGPGSLPVPTADDEVGALARTLNTMLDRLRVAADRQRTFVADAAHELRSPVAAARAVVEVARAHPDAYPVQDLLDDLTPEVARMQALVDDLLVLARVGAAPVARTPVDLRALADDVVDGVRAAARGATARTVDVTVVGGGSALAGEDGVRRVLRNLVDNAVRHARSAVVVRVDEGSLVVDDDGPGIAPEQREAVFERFVRLDDARQRDAGGTGLGLAIAREVAVDLGGSVRLEQAPAGGLRAVVDLAPSDGTPARG